LPEGWDDRDGLIVVAFGARKLVTARVLVALPAVGVGEKLGELVVRLLAAL